MCDHVSCNIREHIARTFPPNEANQTPKDAFYNRHQFLKIREKIMRYDVISPKAMEQY
jgi:hypothetical protein